MSSRDIVLAAAGASGPATYIEDVFSTYLYTGNGSTQTITNGIDLAGKGGLVWCKSRSTVGDNFVFDTLRGPKNLLYTDSNAGQQTYNNSLTSFNTNGFSLGDDYWGWNLNIASNTYASWTFRKQPKFFDVVTYTGDGVDGRSISHSLGSAPGCVIVKCTSNGGTNWAVYHRGTGATKYLFLNTTDAASTAGLWYNTDPTSTNFYVGNFTETNASGYTYVAYLFASNAGGFGLTGTDNVISCGSFTTDGSGNATVNLGYEPQWVLMKKTNSAQDWYLIDNMRQMSVMDSALLRPNTSGAENLNYVAAAAPTATGFYSNGGVGSSSTYIYIAIRRGPMKVPTDGTKVFAPNYFNNTTGTNITTGFPVDLCIETGKDYSTNRSVVDRLRGTSSVTTGSGTATIPLLSTNTTSAEITNTGSVAQYWNNTGYQIPSAFANVNNIFWSFRRAPGFFDEVCRTGHETWSAEPHNLGVVPELIIEKARNATQTWNVWRPADQNLGNLNNNLAFSYYGINPATASTFQPLNDNLGQTYVNYLFASCPGVSKVTSFTGNGSTQTINCGFTAGARFVLIKATSTTGNWMVFDTSRGMTTSTDPWLALNLTSAESATTGACTTTSVGFTVDESKLTGINTNGTSYIALAIA
jgi:hypothetical protein